MFRVLTTIQEPVGTETAHGTRESIVFGLFTFIARELIYCIKKIGFTTVVID